MSSIIVTGATGLAGSAVVGMALADARVERVILWSRKPTGLEHAKIVERKHADFLSYEDVAADIVGSDALIWCLGVAQSEVSPDDYERITFGFATAAGKAVKEHHASIPFCFLSGSGADSTERSRMLFARTKGRAENALLRILPNAYCCRPGYIRPTTPAKAHRTLSNRLMGSLAPMLVRISDKLVIDDVVLGRALLELAHGTAADRVLENPALLALGTPGSNR